MAGFIAPHQQLRANRAGHLIAKGEHLRELEAGVDMQQRKGNRRGIEGLLRQPQHDGRILADGVEHHRPLKLRGHFAQNVNALRFKQAQMAQARRADALAAAIESEFLISTTGMHDLFQFE
jgi:hypothetical protein